MKVKEADYIDLCLYTVDCIDAGRPARLNLVDIQPESSDAVGFFSLIALLYELFEPARIQAHLKLGNMTPQMKQATKKEVDAIKEGRRSGRLAKLERACMGYLTPAKKKMLLLLSRLTNRDYFFKHIDLTTNEATPYTIVDGRIQPFRKERPHGAPETASAR